MKYLFIILAAATMISCGDTDKKAADQNVETPAATGATEAKATSIQWLDSTSLNMGKVPQGRVVEVSFRFKNTGDAPLVISSVEASCGCTVPEKPEKPFLPGEEGVIKAKFDSKGRSGLNTKTVTVTSNTQPETHQLVFSVDVATE